jgi:ribosomal protein S18 acetylase RimI-like enzyme
VSFSIRKATSSDVAAILECLREAFEPYRDSYTPGAFADTVLTPETLLHRLETMCVFVAVRDADEVAGTIACHIVDPDVGHIRGMAVRPACHGAGIASQLLQSVEEELAGRCKRISLDTTAPLRRAILFYEKHGFRRSGVVTDFFGMQLFEFTKIIGNSKEPGPPDVADH